jgi:flagellar biosynthesis GTPase FlhF
MDWEKFRSLSNLTTLGSARETLRQAKKKLKDEYGDNSIVTGSSPIAKKSTPKSKKTFEADDDENSDADFVVSASKKPARGQKRKNSDTDIKGGDDDLTVDFGDEEVYVRPSKQARKTPAKKPKAAATGAAGKGRGKGKKKADDRVDEVLSHSVPIKSEAPNDDEEDEEEAPHDDRGESVGDVSDRNAAHSSSPVVYEFEPL